MIDAFQGLNDNFFINKLIMDSNPLDAIWEDSSQKIILRSKEKKLLEFIWHTDEKFIKSIIDSNNYKLKEYYSKIEEDRLTNLLNNAKKEIIIEKCKVETKKINNGNNERKISWNTSNKRIFGSRTMKKNKYFKELKSGIAAMNRNMIDITNRKLNDMPRNKTKRTTKSRSIDFIDEIDEKEFIEFADKFIHDFFHNWESTDESI